MTSTALYTAFLPILRMAGRWLIRRLVSFGVPKVIAFLEMRIATFVRRQKNARTRRRKQWLGFRIKWRHKVLVWLDHSKSVLKTHMVNNLEKLYDNGLERIPWDTRGERYSSWLKDRRAA